MRISVLVAAIGLGAIAFVSSCRITGPGPRADLAGELGTANHRDAVMSSRFCSGCHPAIFAEHQQNTHGRAFFDEEARMATRGFRREDCIRCHTPRPVFETGIGMTPMQRWTNLEEGNTCMSCHGRAGYDYSRFVGGAECRGAFEPEVASVNHCATCHRIAGTPNQWSHAAHGKQAGNECVDCHMPLIRRPVAVGQPPRAVRSHLFPASSNESQVRRAYDYDARVEGNEVVVRITNSGVGHNFPTANRQRGVESLIIVRDRDGTEIARSRLVCRYPYASELTPHQLTAPRGSQIPSGKSSEHRVPITVADGTVECRLYFKLYRPSPDTDPHLSRCLESRRLPFTDVTPSTAAVVAEQEVFHAGGATTLEDFFDPRGFANTPHGPPSSAPVEIPAGDDAHELDVLAGMLEAHLPEVRARATARLVERFPASAPALVQALGRWSNESFNGAIKAFRSIGARAVPTLREALGSDQLYIRCHARELLSGLFLADDREAVLAAFAAALTLPNPLDRRSAALALAAAGDQNTPRLLRPLLDDGDWDVVHAAARGLALFGDRTAVPAIRAALARARWPETHRELAVALATLGSGAGVQPLLDDLQADDVLQREYTFETLFAITGRHCGYEPGAPSADRLKAWSRLQAWWTRHGADELVHAPATVDELTRAQTWDLVEQLGGGTDTRAGGDDAAIEDELLAYGSRAVPALIEGLTFPSGFEDKRARCCKLLGKIGSVEAAPFLAAALRDPVPAVTEWACWALESCGDADTPAQLRTYADLVPRLVGADRGQGPDAPADRYLARAARSRILLGDDTARPELVGLLLSPNGEAREIAIGALRDRFGENRGYDATATAIGRAEAAARWRER